MLRALGHPVYRRLLAAQVVALLGTGLGTVALGLLAHDLAGPRAGAVLGTAFAVKMLAYVLVAPLASALLARRSRRAVLVGADVVRVAVAAALPFVGEVWQVYLLVFVLQAASATFTPTFQSVVPDVLVEEDDYTAGLSLSRLAYDLEAVVSPLLAAALLLVVPASTLFAGTALGCAASALLVAATVLPRRTGADEPDRDAGSFGRRARRGVVLFVRTPGLRPVLALNLAVASAGAFVLVQAVVTARDVLGRGDGAVALLLAATGAGSMVGAFVLPALLRRVPERPVMLVGGAVAAAATLLVPVALALPSEGAVGAPAALWAAVGLGWSAAETPVGRLLRRHVPAPDLPDAFAAQFSLSHACWLVTYPLAGWLGLAVGTGATALWLGGLAVAATVVAARSWPTRVVVSSAPEVHDVGA
ncbi:putative MFS family arabinose efflux permease [Isoptericola jiangsuensis]|uniref:Putative MFS family arabinose efflux permease n=1 Tax=Isoptericola jiangsuensis TaxID=548579 RepID=A0A2A9EWH4_9MICO|nr:MFS transporter [Isoptericola jiangsuensis]PFG42595.1 putative MFS family arabinose efflux permease [Isoptericola jiangsuensis]